MAEELMVLLFDMLDKMGYSGEAPGIMTMFQNFAKINALIGSDGAKSLFDRITNLEDQMDAMRPGSKLYANASFAASVLSGCQRIPNGSNYKVVLDDRIQWLRPSLSYDVSNTSYTSTWYEYGQVSYLKFYQDLEYVGTRVLNSVVVPMKRVGNPSGNVTMEVREIPTSGGIDSSIVCTSVSKLQTDIPTAGGDVTFTIPGGLILDKDKYYGIQFNFDSASSGNFVAFGLGESSPATLGKALNSYKYYTSWGSLSTGINPRWLAFTLNMTKATGGWAYTQITDAALYAFNQFFAVSDSKQGVLAFNLQDNAGNNLKAGITDKQLLNDLANAEQYGTFRLQVAMSRASVDNISPELRWWGISYMGATA
ncbi:MAG TPA: hypothetical protein VN426_06075 [Syntrophomonadaceae bacterium]|nr:hypothetical protein [Syntrophomonadaceae bacterium]